MSFGLRGLSLKSLVVGFFSPGFPLRRILLLRVFHFGTKAYSHFIQPESYLFAFMVKNISFVSGFSTP